MKSKLKLIHILRSTSVLNIHNVEEQLDWAIDIMTAQFAQVSSNFKIHWTCTASYKANK